MEKINKLSVFSFAKFQSQFGALIGIICGILYSFGGLIIDIFVSTGVLSSDSMLTPGLRLELCLHLAP